MLLYLIRHGQCEYKGTGDIDPPLTELGIRQAQALAQRCRELGIGQIYSSAMTRASQTAEILGQALGLTPAVEPCFGEINMGDVLRRGWNEYPELHAQWVRHEQDITYPGGENGAAAWRRYQVALAPILAGGTQRAAIVAHGGTIRVMVCGMLRIPQTRRFYLGRPPENCGLTTVKWDAEEGRFYLMGFNDVSHLPVLGR